MNKKLRIIVSEPLLLIAIPISIITFFLIVIARPFVRIRIGFLRCDRIGHFAGNTELYLCEKDFKKTDQNSLDLFYYPRKVCNQQLAKMWERRLIVLPWFWLRPICLIIRSFDFLASYRVNEARAGDRDIDNLLDRFPPHIEFTTEEEELGKANLLTMGIPFGTPFVCLTVRDSAYLTHHYNGSDTNYHNYRDSDIQNYVLAAEDLADRGYFVIRMGAKVHKAINTTHSKVIDYASNGMHSDFMDIYLGAKCAFCISTSTGFDAIPFIFRKPIVFINMVPLGILITYREQYIAITRHHFSVQMNRDLTLKEIFTNGVGFCGSSTDYVSNNVNLIENTPEEIHDVVIEMAERLNGSWEAQNDDEDLQHLFWKIFPSDAISPNGQPQHGEIKSRFGAHFLRNNRDWLK